MRCYILDDHYGRELYTKFQEMLPEWEFPVKENVLDPLEYLPYITSNDVVLLDNFFKSPSLGYAPLGEVFLYHLLSSPITPKIIGISNVGRDLLERYEHWNLAYKQGIVIDIVHSKSARDILQSMQAFGLVQ